MEQTEQERRDSEVVETIDDYIDLLGKLKEVTVLNQKEINDSIKYVSYGLLDKVQYVIDLSAPYRKKRWFSWFKDWRIKRRNRKEEREAEKSEEENAKLEQFTNEELRLELEERDQMLLSYEKELKEMHDILESHDLLSLLAPPKEAQVVEQLNSDEKSDDFMKF